jgi:hypothetical protein
MLSGMPLRFVPQEFDIISLISVQLLAQNPIA